MTKTKGVSTNPLKQALIERTQIIFSLVIDCIYIAIWVGLSWGLNKYIIIPLKMNGVDALALTVFKWVSGFATLGALIVQIIRDFILVVLRNYRSLREEIKSGKNP